MPPPATSALERHDMQGLLLSAYKHLPWSANMFVRIDEPRLARRRLAALAGTLTTATGKHHLLATNLALTHAGLERLGLDTASAQFPLAFVDDMAARAAILGDPDPGAWCWGTPADALHVLLMLFAPDEAGVLAAAAAQRAAFAADGLTELRTLVGRRFPDGREHFGFVDGIAQPELRGERRGAAAPVDADNAVAAGEFVLGYVNEYGYPSETVTVAATTDRDGVLPAAAVGRRDFGRNGSYLVFRQLEQDVAAFESFLTDTAAGEPLERDRLAAKIVGRWPSGAPLVLAPDADAPELRSCNAFGFATDRRGERCPVGAHIRRANPRDGFKHDRPAASITRSNHHRLLRRGRPYGPRWCDAPDASRGLLFIALNADIERQFEFVQQTWLNDPNFGGVDHEVDPLVGTQRDSAYFTIPAAPVRRRLAGLPDFVTMRGGAYFFLPGIAALRYLAALEPRPAGAPPADDVGAIDADLGEALAPREHAFAQRIAALIARDVSARFVSEGAPARRDVHVKAHACVEAEFRVLPTLDPALAQGVFVPGAIYPALIRFSNGASDGVRSDARGDVHAMAIKLLCVGPADVNPGQTQDFILLDTPVFPASDAAAYAAFIERQSHPNPLVRALAPLALGPRGLAIGRRVRSSRIGNPLAVRYWSTVAYRLGDPPFKRAVKYSAVPHLAPVALPSRGAPRYLRQALVDVLAAGPASFDFLVQPRTLPTLSVEDPRAVWREIDAPFYKVATIRIPQQAAATTAHDALGENLAFDPWHGLPQHRPLGGINRTRRVVYATIAELRRRLNDVDPSEPRVDARG